MQRESKNWLFITPPPNLTGILHIGHLLNATVQRLITNTLYMYGDNVKVKMGYDHSPLYAEIIARGELEKEKIDINPENIIARVSRNSEFFASENEKLFARFHIPFVEKTRYYTNDQRAQQHLSAAWEKLVRSNLIYRSVRLVYYDRYLRTSLSDIEVETRAIRKDLYYIRYRIDNTNDYIRIATTRPETIEADIAVAVNGNDERWKHIHNATIINPINGRKLQVIKNDRVIPDFGTGILKITPCYDRTDFEIWNTMNDKTDLLQYLIYDNTFYFNERSIAHGLDYQAGREYIISYLQSISAIDEIVSFDSHDTFNRRTDSDVHLILSSQIFLRLSVLHSKYAQEFKALKFYGYDAALSELSRFTNLCEDWCISRQNIYGYTIEFDGVSDRIDTWFASGIWLRIVDAIHHDNIVIITGRDIAFFWIYRMYLLMREIYNVQPFHIVFFHGLLCDRDRQKISKSKGNAADLRSLSTHAIEKLQLVLLSTGIESKDIVYNPDRILFVNRALNKLKHITTLLQSKQIKDNVECSEYSIFMLNRIYECFPNNAFEAARYTEKILNFICNEYSNRYFKYARTFDIDCIHIVHRYILVLFSLYAPVTVKELSDILYGNKPLDLRAEYSALTRYISKKYETGLNLNCSIYIISKYSDRFDISGCDAAAYILGDKKTNTKKQKIGKYILCSIDNRALRDQVAADIAYYVRISKYNKRYSVEIERLQEFLHASY